MIFCKRLRYILRRFEFKLRIRKMKKTRSQKICIFQTPLHRNIGDHFIALSERKFLNSIVNNLPVFEIPNEMFYHNKQSLIKAIKSNDMIIITGGGFIGNIWEGEEKVLESILKTFPCNKVIVFPQTVYFDESKPDYNEYFDNCKHILESHKNLVVFVRERNSYNFIKINMGKVDVRLVPDIALSYPKIENIISKTNCIGLCLRNDTESAKNNKVVEKINLVLTNNKFSIVETNTISKNRVFESNREQQCLNKIREFSRYKIVVTDRLHGMIFSYLAGTPCIVLDNTTNKVSGVYREWLSECKNIVYIEDEFNENILENFIKNIVDGKIDSNDYVEMKKFNTLKEEIIKNVEWNRLIK